MENREEVRQFLSTRRARLSPTNAGIPLLATRRRVPGLRREEVAQLAGISTDYYTRIEKGNLRGASDQVLEAIARALQLDEAEQLHLLNLARAARGSIPTRRRAAATSVREGLQQMLDAVTAGPAYIVNGRLDLVATNALGAAFWTAAIAGQPHPANLARFTFLDPAARDFHANWDLTADATVALLRAEAGNDPHNRSLTDLVGELVTVSDEFRALWAKHRVRIHRTGTKHFVHNVVGELTLHFNTMPLPADPGLALTVFTADPASPTEERLKALASWTADPTTAALAKR